MKYVQIKQWHTIVGILMAIPLITLAITGSLIIHNRPLGFREAKVTERQVGWLPGYQADHGKKGDDLKDIKAFLTVKNGYSFVGTEYGLVEITPSASRLVPEFKAIGINSIQNSGKGILICTQKGAWLQEKNTWRQLYPEECKQANELSPKVLMVIAENKGALISTNNGKDWGPYDKLKQSLALLPAGQKQKPLSVTRFLLDIHTGHIFFAKEWKWVWVDMLAILGLMLSPTGLWLWIKTRKPKKGIKH